MSKTFVKELRALKAKVAKAEANKGALRLELMLLLVEAKPKELIWRDEYDTWDELLRKEKPCSVTSFYRFERGLKLLPLEEVQQLGVTATTVLVDTPVSYRNQLVKKVRKWLKERKTVPNHTQVSRYVWEKRRQLAPAQDYVSRGKLVRYIDALKGQLKEAGLKPKPLSRVK